MTAVSKLLARIAALHPSDRQWLLAEVSAPERALLTAALEGHEGTATDALVTLGDRGTLGARELIASAAPEDVALALQTQPAWLSTVLMRMDEWPWSASIRNHLPLTQRQMPTVGQPGLAVKPALSAAILQSFARSLRLIEASARAPTPRLPRFETLLQRLQAGVLR